MAPTRTTNPAHSPSPPSGFSSFRLRRNNHFPWTNNAVTPTAQTPVTPHVDEEWAEVNAGVNRQFQEQRARHQLQSDQSGDDGEGEEDEEDEQEREPESDDHRTSFLSVTGEVVEADEEEEGGIEEVPMEIDAPFDPTALGLKEIGNLASWTVSSCKPGCGVEALRDEDTGLFWQSDGPQPHHLNIHFSRLVSILSIRIFLDFEADESYTPTRITLLAGTGYHDLIPFSALSFEQPKGWIDVPLDHVGGGEDGKTLRAFLIQVRVVENHQNGKDTHVRGLKVYARDDRARGALPSLGGITDLVIERKGKAAVVKPNLDAIEWVLQPDWMGDPELR